MSNRNLASINFWLFFFFTKVHLEIKQLNVAHRKPHSSDETWPQGGALVTKNNRFPLQILIGDIYSSVPWTPPKLKWLHFPVDFDTGELCPYMLYIILSLDVCSEFRLTKCPMVVAKVSAIQDISLSPVLMSGAGTSIPGPAQPHKTNTQEIKT